MYSFSECHKIIEDEISKIDFNQKSPKELYEPIRYVLNLGGKRIRPVITLMACNLFTEDIFRALKPAVAIEIFHNFTLVHDDIMDNASIRRNKPTVHSKWNDNIAILSGDAMQIVAYEFLCQAEPAFLKPLINIFNRTALEVCEGQQLDMNYSHENNVTLDEYLHMIELKTSVLLAASLKIGAICGGASVEDADKLYEFGRNLGLAFQIQDDYLDVYADQDVFGKAVGGDIAENKKTFLLVKALELAEGKNAVVLQNAIHNHIIDPDEKISEVKKVYDQLNIRGITETKIQEFSGEALKYLESVGVTPQKKEQLLQLSRDLMSRIK